MARIWAVLERSDPIRTSRLELQIDLQDGVDLADELHPDGQGSLGDRATELCKSQ